MSRSVMLLTKPTMAFILLSVILVLLSGLALSQEEDVTTTQMPLTMSLRKCCPEGKVAHWSRALRKVQCLEQGNVTGQEWDWVGNFAEFTDEGMEPAKEKPEFLTEYGLPGCDVPKVLYPDIHRDSHDFAVFSDGSFFRITGQSVQRGMYCLDRFVTNPKFTSTMRGALVCQEVLWVPPAIQSGSFNGSATIRKCCGANQVFNAADEKCVDYGSVSDGFQLYDSRDGHALNVTSPTMRYEILSGFHKTCKRIAPKFNFDGSYPFHMLETGHLYFPEGHESNDSNQTGVKLHPADEYCLDFVPNGSDSGHEDFTQVALICELTEEAKLAARVANVEELKARFRESSCDQPQADGTKTLCVLKCCGEGKLLAMSPKKIAVCEPISGDHKPWHPVFHDDRLNEVALDPSKYKILAGFRPACKTADLGTLTQVPAFDPNQAMRLLSNGEVYSTKYDRRFSGPEYCMDYFKPPNISDQVVHITLLCYPEQPEERPIFIIYGICLLLSSIFLGLTLFLSLLLPDSNRLSTWTMLSFVSSLLVASLLLAMMQLFQSLLVAELCLVFAFVTYYSFLAAFLWLNVMSFDIWYTVRRNLPSTRSHMSLRYLKRGLYAFGVPLALAAVVLVFQFAPGLPSSHFTEPVHPQSRCWFRNDWTIGTFFYGPIALILIANLVFFILTTRYLILHRKNTQNLNVQQSTKKRLALFGRLFVVMGVTWLTEVISWKVGPEEIWYVTDLVNALTGLLVFVAVICRRQALKDLRKVHPFFSFLLSCGRRDDDRGSSGDGGGSRQHHTTATNSGKSNGENTTEKEKKFSISVASATQDTEAEGDHPMVMTTFAAPTEKTTGPHTARNH